MMGVFSPMIWFADARALTPTEAEPWIDEKATALAIRANQAGRESTRRRCIDPTTCDRDY